ASFAPRPKYPRVPYPELRPLVSAPYRLNTSRMRASSIPSASSLTRKTATPPDVEYSTSMRPAAGRPKRLEAYVGVVGVCDEFGENPNDAAADAAPDLTPKMPRIDFD